MEDPCPVEIQSPKGVGRTGFEENSCLTPVKRGQGSLINLTCRATNSIIVCFWTRKFDPKVARLFSFSIEFKVDWFLNNERRRNVCFFSTRFSLERKFRSSRNYKLQFSLRSKRTVVNNGGGNLKRIKDFVGCGNGCDKILSDLLIRIPVKVTLTSWNQNFAHVSI